MLYPSVSYKRNLIPCILNIVKVFIGDSYPVFIIFTSASFTNRHRDEKAYSEMFMQFSRGIEEKASSLEYMPGVSRTF